MWATILYKNIYEDYNCQKGENGIYYRALGHLAKGQSFHCALSSINDEGWPRTKIDKFQ